MKKKTIKGTAVLALILALAGIALSAFALGTQPEDQTHLIDDLYRQNRELEEKVTQLQEQLEQFMTVSSLKTWELKAEPWADCTGADVTLTAEPSEYVSGMGATLLVTLEGRQIASVPCVWDGQMFTATANLSAADGYNYFCLLSGPGGVRQLSLMGPDLPNPQLPVFLQSALSAYCNLVVRDWSVQNGNTIVLSSVYAQVQLPQIYEDALTITSQELVLRLNDQIIAKAAIPLTPSEVAGSYETIISDMHMPMPELEEGDQLSLHLEITLSDGRNLQAFGISWHLERNNLIASVG